MIYILIMLLILCILAMFFSIGLTQLIDNRREYHESVKHIYAMTVMCFSCKFMTFNDGVIKCSSKLPFFLEDHYNEVVLFNSRNMTFGRLPKDGECRAHEYEISKCTIYNNLTILKYNTLRMLYGVEHT